MSNRGSSGECSDPCPILASGAVVLFRQQLGHDWHRLPVFSRQHLSGLQTNETWSGKKKVQGGGAPSDSTFRI